VPIRSSAPRSLGLGVLVVMALLGGCSSGTGSSSTTGPPPGSLNVTPCNYARAWHDSPTQFSEFAVMARYARGADSAHLRSVGQRLASAVTSHDTAAISAAAADLFTTCKQLGLVTAARAAPTTTG
jgi:hypothetical protein